MRIGQGGESQALVPFLRPPVEHRRPDRPAPVNRSISGEQSSSLELTVTTAEGDKVTLSAQALQAFSYESGGGRRSASRNSELSVSVSVEGDLSQQELDDIRKLALALGKSVRQAERGNVGQALNTVAKSASPDTIAAFQFKYERREQLDYRQNAYQSISDLA